MIDKINKQLPPIFQLRLEDNKLELYMVEFSDIVTAKNKDTKRFKRFKTICDKKDVDKYLSGMQVILDMFYVLGRKGEK